MGKIIISNSKITQSTVSDWAHINVVIQGWEPRHLQIRLWSSELIDKKVKTKSFFFSRNSLYNTALKL